MYKSSSFPRPENVRPSEKSVQQMRKMTFDKVDEYPKKKAKREKAEPSLSKLQVYVGKKVLLDDGTEAIVKKMIIDDENLVYFEGQDLKDLKYVMIFPQEIVKKL